MNPQLSPIAKTICQSLGFEYVQYVGRGAFKETFQVTNEGYPFALKVLFGEFSLRRMEREIQAMRACDHPNIAKLLAVSTFYYDNHEYIYIIEEFLGGGTLAQKLQERNLSIEETVALGKRLISAVTHIAKLGFVHRDIKPENILFREDGVTPVVVDFGLVRALGVESLTKTWLLQGPGTPYYSSPEQLNNEKELIDWRTDQFAVAVVLSLCCFGVHPYHHEGDNIGDVVERVGRRGRLGKDFVLKVTETEMYPLTKMAAQWPVNRYRTPQMLLESWNKMTSIRSG